MMRRRQGPGNGRCVFPSMTLVLMILPGIVAAQEKETLRERVRQVSLEDPSRYLNPWNPTRGKGAARAMFLIGTFYDFYTTKRGLDMGLKEGNPVLRSVTRGFGAKGMAVPKLLTWFLIERAHFEGDSRLGDQLLFTLGYVQMGAGLANHDRIRSMKERRANRLAP